MDLNTIALSFLGCVVLYGAYLYWQSTLKEIPKTLATPWGQQVGRSKLIQSKTGDASMATERNRRQAIQGASRLNPATIKESRTTTGSATGAIETFFLSSICPACVKILEPIIPPIVEICTAVLEGGNVFTDFGNAFDANGGVYDQLYDAGYPDAKVCDAEAEYCEPNFVMDGGPGAYGSEQVFDADVNGVEYDAGSPDSETCAPIGCEVVFDNLATDTAVCDVVEAEEDGLIMYDAGNPNTKVCDI